MREEVSGWGTHVYLWWIQVNVKVFIMNVSIHKVLQDALFETGLFKSKIILILS